MASTRYAVDCGAYRERGEVGAEAGVRQVRGLAGPPTALKRRFTIWQKTTINIAHTHWRAPTHTHIHTHTHTHTVTLRIKLLSILYGFNWQLAAFESRCSAPFCSTWHWQGAWQGVVLGGYHIKGVGGLGLEVPGAYLTTLASVAVVVAPTGISLLVDSPFFPFFCRLRLACCGCSSLKATVSARVVRKVLE